MVVVKVLVKAGSAQDERGKEGLAHLTALLLSRGTQKHGALELAEELDFLGASLSTDVSRDYTTLTLTTLRKNLKASMALLTEILLSPTFPSEELEKKRQEILGHLKTWEEDPGWVAQKTFLETFYPPDHPYGHIVEGREESLKALTRADVQGFYHTYWRPNNTIVAFVGSVTLQEAQTLLKEGLRDWAPAEVPQLPWPPFEPPRDTAWVTLDKEVRQAHILLGQQGISRSHPDYYAVQIMNYLLGGGGFESHLMKRVREELGLVYDIRSSFSAYKHPGPL